MASPVTFESTQIRNTKHANTCIFGDLPKRWMEGEEYRHHGLCSGKSIPCEQESKWVSDRPRAGARKHATRQESERVREWGISPTLPLGDLGGGMVTQQCNTAPKSYVMMGTDSLTHRRAKKYDTGEKGISSKLMTLNKLCKTTSVSNYKWLNILRIENTNSKLHQIHTS